MKMRGFVLAILFALSVGWTWQYMVSSVKEMAETKRTDKKMSVLKQELQQRKDMLESFKADSFVKKSWHPNVVAKRICFFKKEILELEGKLRDLEKRREIKENPPVLINLPPEVLAAGY